MKVKAVDAAAEWSVEAKTQMQIAQVVCLSADYSILFIYAADVAK